MAQLGINGFGRIGRVILRACLQKSDFEITAINDPAIDVQYICYLIKFDSTHGKFNGSVTHNKDEIFINDKRIKIFHEKLPANIPWQSAGVHYVIEASGMFTTLEKASGHLASETVRKVILTAPSVDVPMIILGVNDDTLIAGQKVISCASSTLYCLAPIVKVLEECFGILEGFVTSIHAMTPSLKPLDGLCLRGRNWRDHRSIHQNIIPAMTGACKAIGKIIPRVKDKLCGLAFRVPIVNVSVLDITIRISRNTTLQEIIEKVEKASNAEFKNIIRISNENAVSSDFIGETHSCILDADSSLQLKSNFFKLVCWYENEYSYAYRVIDTIAFCERKLSISVTLNPAKQQDNVQQTECNSRKEVLGSTSQDTGLRYKTLPRQFVLKKPLSSQLSSNIQALVSKDTKKRNEFFKIWNEEREPNIRQNRNCLFHSCIAITPRNLEQMTVVKAQDRLEMLKKEFSKMVNVTDSLLKKSYIGNFSMKSEDKAIKDNSENNFTEESLGNSYEEITHSNRMFGDCKSDISSINDTKNPGKDSNFKKLEVIIQCDLKENVQCQSQSSENIKQDKESLTENEHKSIQGIGENHMNSFKLNSLYSKSNVTNNNNEAKCLLANESEKEIIRGQTNLNDHEITRELIKKEESILDTERYNNKNVESELSNNLINELNDTSSSINKTENKPPLTIKQNMDESEDCVKFEPVKDITNINISYTTAMDTIVKMPELDGDITNTSFLTADDEDLDKSLSKFDRISPEPYSFVSDCTSKCGSRSNTVNNFGTYRHNKEDIYDKLDSVSGTDSNNSFQINERKSQIIDLSDLTTSLEDIRRLDKICKIIEISDDLSNKLFSQLDNDDGLHTKNKKWSFKDLCERIKLDDFCDNVFGKTSY